MSAATPSIEIRGRRIGEGFPVYVVAEMSGNHGGHVDEAIALIKAAKEAGADAVKLQTYTPDTMTLECREPLFRVTEGPWAGRILHDLYTEAYTPWEWQPTLQKVAADVGIALFSSAFDPTAVEFLQRLEMPAYKVASYELVDVPLIRRIAQTGKPVILSTGMATDVEISEAVQAAREGGATQIALLKCTSDYPARAADMNLLAIPRLAEQFGMPVGLSDHTQGTGIALAAVALGARIIEKHLMLSRAGGALDAEFSLEPEAFQHMVEGIRAVEQAMGQGGESLSPSEIRGRDLRRSLFVVADVKVGAPFTTENIRSIRPGQGLPPKFLPVILGQRATKDLRRGTPLSWGHVSVQPKEVSHAAAA